MLAFKKLHLNLLNIVTLWIIPEDQPYQTQNNLDYIQIEIFKVNPQRDRNIFFWTVCELSKGNLYQLIHQYFGHISITRLKIMARKGLMDSILENIYDLE